MRKATANSALERFTPLILAFILTVILVRGPLSQLIANYQGWPSIVVDSFFIVILLFAIILLVDRYLAEEVARFFLEGPDGRKPGLDSPKWQRHDIDSEGHAIPLFIQRQMSSAPLILALHGWKSSSDKISERAQKLFDCGAHVAIIDMRGHGHAAADPEFTAAKQVQDVNTILNSIDSILPQSEITSFSIYGHSLGAFVALGFAKQASGWWEERWGCYILESPMTSYRLIMQEGRWALSTKLTPMIIRYMRRAWKLLHPELVLEEDFDIEIPLWGMPPCPTLVVQASNDAMLGRSHYDMLMSEFGDICEGHIIEELEHSGSSGSTVRDELVSKYVKSTLF